MRTYLFADFGKGPRVAACRPNSIMDATNAGETRREQWIARTVRHYTKAADCRRWWLVECDSADAGRAIIARAEVGMWHGGIVREGRILDSGGTAQAEGGAE